MSQAHLCPSFSYQLCKVRSEHCFVREAYLIFLLLFLWLGCCYPYWRCCWHSFFLILLCCHSLLSSWHIWFAMPRACKANVEHCAVYCYHLFLSSLTSTKL